MRALLLAAAVLTAGCGSYDEFTLPPAPGDTRVTWTWSALDQPVIDREGWVDVLNPSVVWFQGRLWNLYSAFDGQSWHTAVATSTNGREWAGKETVLSPDTGTWEGSYIAANGSALVINDQLAYWYQAGPKGATRLGLARSTDGRNWNKEPAPVLDLGPRGSWDERALGDPYVLRAGEELYLYYLGEDRARRQRLGVARSRDGVRWEKLRSNPILELGEFGAFDEEGLGEPAVWRSPDWYWMLYTGRDRREHRRLGLARSRDGVHWERTPFVIAGEQPWNQAVLCDPTVLPERETVRVWFGGGDRPSPDEHLNGRIGYATLRATLAK